MRHLLILMTSLTFSLPALSLDLLSAYEIALGNDPLFRAALKETEAQQANENIGRAGLLPQISASAIQLSNDSRINGPLFLNGPSVTTTRAYPSTNAVIQLNQPLFNLQALAQMRQGKAQAALGEARLIFSLQDLLVRIFEAYTNVLFASDSLNFVNNQRIAYSERLLVNEKTFKAGEGTITDFLETKASLEMAIAETLEAENSLSDAKRKLEAILGEKLDYLGQPKPLAANFKRLPLEMNTIDNWRQIAIDNNPQLRASKKAIEVARQEYEKQQSANYPALSGVVSWGQQSSQNTATINQTAITASIGVQLTVPIYAGGAITGRSVQSFANYQKARAEFDHLQNQITIELNKQFDQVRSGARRIDAMNRAVESASELTIAMRKSVQGGQRINLDILLAERALAVAQRDLARAKYDYLGSFMKFKQQIGDLGVEDLRIISHYFSK